MQQLGLMHRYAHEAGKAAQVEAVAQSTGQMTPLIAAPMASSGFPTHDAGLCGVLDHLSAGQALTSLHILTLATLPSLTYLSLLSGNFIARWAAQFNARGPPVSR